MKKIIWLFIGILIVSLVGAGIVAVKDDLLFDFERSTGVKLEDCVDCEFDMNGITLGLIKINGVWYPITSQELLDMIVNLRNETHNLNNKIEDLEVRITKLEKPALEP